MRFAGRCWMGCLIAGVGLGIGPQAEAQQSQGRDGMLARTECVALVRRKRAEEAGGMREMMGRDPGDVARERGPEFLQQVRDYIKVREAVLFRCPANVLNATAAPLEERMKAQPPLPGKGPKLVRPAIQRRPALVPLPVPRPI